MPGGKKKAWRKKRKYELGHQPANTMLSSNKTVRQIRVRGGNVKWRATDWIPGTTHGVVKLSPAKYVCCLQCFILLMGWPPLDVVYNASNNELVRTQNLVKSAFVHVDAARFKQWWLLRRKPHMYHWM
ncbi:40S ribosomal protein S8-like [Carya illinoinensis]|uniref:40S ribosomal protein S8 n=1 Tax=Carya illinoinensis TaxID=32201 RepID=A0A8T1RNG7_CARIL|nr:40S ribosomal protein S8-like [Carya illinoinensis]KAG6667612.1 hypothetical protein CIPAW_01G113100 [Carya illinoinensis]